MSLRIRSAAGLTGLSEQAKRQIKEKAPNALLPSKKKSRVFKTSDGLAYCAYPSADPAVWLHNALVAEFGSIELHEHGEMAHEVVIAQSPKNYRYDHIHIATRTAIEFDGWSNHSRLAAFKRDRDKDKQALCLGFIVFRVTNQEVRHSLSVKIDELKKIISMRERHLDRVERYGKHYTKVMTCV